MFTSVNENNVLSAYLSTGCYLEPGKILDRSRRAIKTPQLVDATQVDGSPVSASPQNPAGGDVSSPPPAAQQRPRISQAHARPLECQPAGLRVRGGGTRWQGGTPASRRDSYERQLAELVGRQMWRARADGQGSAGRRRPGRRHVPGDAARRRSQGRSPQRRVGASRRALTSASTA